MKKVLFLCIFMSSFSLLGDSKNLEDSLKNLEQHLLALVDDIQSIGKPDVSKKPESKTRGKNLYSEFAIKSFEKKLDQIIDMSCTQLFNQALFKDYQEQLARYQKFVSGFIALLTDQELFKYYGYSHAFITSRLYCLKKQIKNANAMTDKEGALFKSLINDLNNSIKSIQDQTKGALYIEKQGLLSSLKQYQDFYNTMQRPKDEYLPRPSTPGAPGYLPPMPPFYSKLKNQLQNIVDNNFDNDKISFAVIEKYTDLLDDFDDLKLAGNDPRFVFDKTWFSYWGSRALMQKYNDVYTQAQSLKKDWIDVLQKEMNTSLINLDLAQFAYKNALNNYKKSFEFLKKEGKAPQDVEAKFEQFENSEILKFPKKVDKIPDQTKPSPAPSYLPPMPPFYVTLKNQLQSIVDDNVKNNKISFAILEKYTGLLDDFEDLKLSGNDPRFAFDKRWFSYWGSRALMQKYNDVYAQAQSLKKDWIDVLQKEMDTSLINIDLAEFAYKNALSNYKQSLEFLKKDGKASQDAESKLKEFEAFQPIQVKDN